MTDSRNSLFDQYARLLTDLQPKVFVAENVSGLVKGTMKGLFKEILRTLKSCGYKVRCRVLDAQWLGVPQVRKRTIFVGVRNDIEAEPTFPSPLSYRYTVRDACPEIAMQIVSNDKYQSQWGTADLPHPTMLASGSCGSSGKVADDIRVIHSSGGFSRTNCTNTPSPTITASQCRLELEWKNSANGEFEVIVAENKRNIDENDISKYAIGDEWELVPVGGKSKKYLNLVKADPNKPSPTVTATGGCASAASVVHPYQKRKVTIEELKRICGFPDDFKLPGSYGQQWARLGNSVPPVMMFHIASAIRDRVLK